MFWCKVKCCLKYLQGVVQSLFTKLDLFVFIAPPSYLRPSMLNINEVTFTRSVLNTLYDNSVFKKISERIVELGHICLSIVSLYLSITNCEQGINCRFISPR